MQRYFVKERKDNYFLLENDDMHHVRNVMRMSSGDKVECVYKEKLYICEVVDPNVNKFVILAELDDDNELDLDITIAIGLVKEKKMDIILQKLTELGVTKIIPVEMERSIVRLDDKKFKKKKERWEKICKEASEQSKRNKIPVIDDVRKVEDLKLEGYDFMGVCSVANRDNLINKYLQANVNYAKMIFVIGPEGGISAREEAILNDIGYKSVSLGKRVLRVETAAIYVCSIVNFSSMG
jgi:16S rRNA (uracil1498-N3)-methyltransferase